MAVQAGIKPFQYEVREPIDAGFMGEAYCGYDTQLEREVELKVLPEEFSRVSAAKRRFSPRSIIPTLRRSTGRKNPSAPLPW